LRFIVLSADLLIQEIQHEIADFLSVGLESEVAGVARVPLAAETSTPPTVTV
jgi:hypothetical protein